jgi:hypothetical protein
LIQETTDIAAHFHDALRRLPSVNPVGKGLRPQSAQAGFCASLARPKQYLFEPAATLEPAAAMTGATGDNGELAWP